MSIPPGENGVVARVVTLTPGAPPAPADFRGKNFLRKNFHPFSGLDGGSWQQTVEVGNIFIHI